MIGIINYGMGNLGSVKKKLDNIGIISKITDNPEELTAFEKLILPGVGHFGNAVKELKTRSFWNALNEEVLIKKKPILGICLGMQLMARYSEEGDTEGLSWFDAIVKRFNVSDKLKYKVPHMGWNTTNQVKDSSLFEKINPDAAFYFVHSYHVQCNYPEDILAETTYDYPFTSAFQKENIFGVQFHPEKSHDAGEILLRNFVNL